MLLYEKLETKIDSFEKFSNGDGRSADEAQDVRQQGGWMT